MAGRQTAAHDAAEKQFNKAPEGAKPSASDLSRKHGLSESTIHRAKWFIAHKAEKKAAK